MRTTLSEHSSRRGQSTYSCTKARQSEQGIDADTRRVTIVGTGVECASWAANFLAHGADVVIAAPVVELEATLRGFVANAWQTLSQLGLAPEAVPKRLSFQPDLRRALAGADLVLWCRRASPKACFYGAETTSLETI